MTSIGDYLRLDGNASLTNLNGLKNLNYKNIEFVFLSDNPNLSDCCIQPICDFLEDDGYAEVFGNAHGCLSVSGIQVICKSVPLDELIQFFPNPTTSVVYLRAPAIYEWDITIWDAAGRIVPRLIQDDDRIVDLSYFPPGIYFLQVTNEEHSITKRIIKQ